MADGFLGRWAQRKADARQGRPLVEPELPAKPPHASAPLSPATAGLVAAPDLSGPHTQPPTDSDAVTQPPALTLQDADALVQDSDFKPFIARGVDPAVRNAAMKKLFTDPHYNVMDRLDIYIDDYSQADPLPLSMLRKMASAQFLNLVDEEPITNPTTRQPDHAHPDLRLQPDHAPVEPDPGRGAE